VSIVGKNLQGLPNLEGLVQKGLSNCFPIFCAQKTKKPGFLNLGNKISKIHVK